MGSKRPLKSGKTHSRLRATSRSRTTSGRRTGDSVVRHDQDNQSPAPYYGGSGSIQAFQRHLGNRFVQRLMAAQTGEEIPGVPVATDLENGILDQSITGRIQNRCGQGSRLNNDRKNRMEQVFETSFDEVRVHTDQEADALSQALHAKAFTLGQDIFFSRSASPMDTALLTHELTHVVQQSKVDHSGPLRLGPADDAYEREADSVAAEAQTQIHAPIHGASRPDSRRAAPAGGDPSMTAAGPGIQRSIFDTLSDVGNWAGVAGLAGSALQGADDLGTAVVNGLGGAAQSASEGATLSGITSPLGAVTSGLGLVTGGAGMYDAATRPGTFGLDDLTDFGVNAASAFSGLTGTLSSLGVGSLAAGGESGLAATALGSGAMGSAGAFGTLGAALGSAGAVAGAGAGGFALGHLLDEGVGGLMNVTGAGAALDEMRGISRPEGQSGDYTLSGMGGDAMAAMDRTATGAMRSLGILDESKPAYTQTLGWKLAEVLPSWLQ